MHKVRQAIRKHRKLLSACAMVLAIALMFWAVNSPAIVGVRIYGTAQAQPTYLLLI